MGTVHCGSELARDRVRSGTSMAAGIPLSWASSLPQVFSAPSSLRRSCRYRY